MDAWQVTKIILWIAGVWTTLAAIVALLIAPWIARASKEHLEWEKEYKRRQERRQEWLDKYHNSNSQE